MQFEDSLRDALQRDAAELEPVGPGPDDARRRAFRRKRRMQSGLVVLSATALVGATIGVIETRSDGPGARVQAQGTNDGPPSALAWKTVDGTVLYAQKHFTSSDGVTYALSTAPGTKASTTGVDPQELYSSRDGVAWTHTALGAKPWVQDLAEDKGVLYAVGTGPGFQADSVAYNLATSDDGGAKWSLDSVPVSFTPLRTTLPATLSTSVHVARGPHTTVVIAKASYQVTPSNIDVGDNGWRYTATGIDVMDYAGCKVARSSGAPKACAPKVVSSYSWSQLGIANPEALNQEIALVRDDGQDWQTVQLPDVPNSMVSDVTATSHGFLLAEQQSGDGMNRSTVALLSSADGRTWSPVAGAPTLEWVGVEGDRIIGTNAETQALYTSGDAGATWSTTSDLGSLVPGTDPVEAENLTVETGPLGYAAIVRTSAPVTANTSENGTPVTAAPNGNNEHVYLLHSTNGVTWSTTDLSKEGAPANGFVSSVSVGADHIEVSYETPGTKGTDGAPDTYNLVTLIGTPKA